MKKQLLGMSIAGIGLLFANGAIASPLISTVSDDPDGTSAGTIYHGGTAPSAYGDVVSANNDNRFDIEKMTVVQDSSHFTFDIHTNFATNAGIFSNQTNSGNGIGFGDLFLASSWTPDPAGTSGANFDTDNAYNGTLWTYALVLDNNFGQEGESGSLALYKLEGASNADNAILSNQLMKNGTGAQYRQYQEVLANTSNGTATGVTGQWSVSAGLLSMNIDLSGSSLMDSDSLAFHWTMYCGNDVIEGEVPVSAVPEPGVLSLLGIGIAGLVFVRRRQQKAA